jgi:ATP-dependent DNA helicase DinG
MKENIDLIFREDGIIKKFKEDYVPRPSQIEGANLLYDALKNNENTILEGPCGFGKTFAYLSPVFEIIAESGFNKKAVIVTNGIALQEQLFYNDIPLMKKIFKEIYSYGDFRFCLLKGKQNFVCNKKLTDLISENYIKKNPDEQIQKIIDW